MDAFVSTIVDTLLSVFAASSAPLCVAVFLLFVVYALLPENRKKFFPTPTSVEGSCADRSPTR